MKRNAVKSIGTILLGGVFTTVFSLISVESNAQTLGGTLSYAPSDSVEILQNLLEQKRAERTSLERMLGAINSVDSVYKDHYPTWMVIDEDLRQRIFKSFRNRNAETSGDSMVTVVTSPDGREIVELSIGSAAMGRLETYRHLSDSLQNTVIAANYPLRRIDATPRKPRETVPFGALPKVVSVDASAFDTQLLFSNGWGVEARLGHDEIGYPFWLTGSMRVLALINKVKIGVVVPFKFGRQGPEILGPLDIRPRFLNGATGFAAEYDHQIDDHLLGFRLTVGELNKYVSGQLTDDRRPYYLHTVAQVLYSRKESLGNGEHQFTLTGGLGFHQIALGEVQDLKKIVAIKKTNFGGPILRAEYMRQGPTMYGFSFQFYSSVVELTGWLELMKNFLYVDLRYSTTVFREPKPWEQSYFFMISPRFRVAF